MLLWIDCHALQLQQATTPPVRGVLIIDLHAAVQTFIQTGARFIDQTLWRAGEHARLATALFGTGKRRRRSISPSILLVRLVRRAALPPTLLSRTPAGAPLAFLVSVKIEVVFPLGEDTHVSCSFATDRLLLFSLFLAVSREQSLDCCGGKRRHFRDGAAQIKLRRGVCAKFYS